MEISLWLGIASLERRDDGKSGKAYLEFHARMIPDKQKSPDKSGLLKVMYPRNVLISRAVTHQVLPPLRSLTAVFGMGTGVSSSQ